MRSTRFSLRCTCIFRIGAVLTWTSIVFGEQLKENFRDTQEERSAIVGHFEDRLTSAWLTSLRLVFPGQLR